MPDSFLEFLATSRTDAAPFVESLRHSKRATREPIGSLAKRQGLITEADLEAVLTRQSNDGRPFGELAHDLGFLGPGQVRALLQFQRLWEAVRVTEIAVATGQLDPDEAIALLDRFVADAGLRDRLEQLDRLVLEAETRAKELSGRMGQVSGSVQTPGVIDQMRLKMQHWRERARAAEYELATRDNAIEEAERHALEASQIKSSLEIAIQKRDQRLGELAQRATVLQAELERVAQEQSDERTAHARALGVVAVREDERRAVLEEGLQRARHEIDLLDNERTDFLDEIQRLEAAVSAERAKLELLEREAQNLRRSSRMLEERILDDVTGRQADAEALQEARAALAATRVEAEDSLRAATEREAELRARAEKQARARRESDVRLRALRGELRAEREARRESMEIDSVRNALTLERAAREEAEAELEQLRSQVGKTKRTARDASARLSAEVARRKEAERVERGLQRYADRLEKRLAGQGGEHGGRASA